MASCLEQILADEYMRNAENALCAGLLSKVCVCFMLEVGGELALLFLNMVKLKAKYSKAMQLLQDVFFFLHV